MRSVALALLAGCLLAKPLRAAEPPFAARPEVRADRTIEGTCTVRLEAADVAARYYAQLSPRTSEWDDSFLVVWLEDFHRAFIACGSADPSSVMYFDTKWFAERHTLVKRGSEVLSIRTEDRRLIISQFLEFPSYADAVAWIPYAWQTRCASLSSEGGAAVATIEFPIEVFLYLRPYPEDARAYLDYTRLTYVRRRLFSGWSFGGWSIGVCNTLGKCIDLVLDRNFKLVGTDPKIPKVRWWGSR